MSESSVRSHTGSLAVAPDDAIGWTHIWDGRTQLPISEDVACMFVLARMIEYSPEDGPNARVYRPLRDLSNEDLARRLA